MIEYLPRDFPRPAPELSHSYVRCLDSGEWWPDVWGDEPTRSMRVDACVEWLMERKWALVTVGCGLVGVGLSGACLMLWCGYHGARVVLGWF